MFQRTDFDRFAREHPRLEHKLLERTLAELDRTRRWMLLLGRMNAEQKLANFLLEMADRVANDHVDLLTLEKATWQLPLTRQQIADILGLTIETVSRQFSRMKSEGLIGLPAPRMVTLLDRVRLKELAQ